MAKLINGKAIFGEMDHAAAATPVPGGVRPMTIVCLLGNMLRPLGVCALFERWPSSFRRRQGTSGDG